MTSAFLPVGILALQGDFAAHGKALEARGLTWRPVIHPSDLQNISALVLPGGESSTLLKLSSDSLRESISEHIRSGCPTLATCAGLIFIAHHVSQPSQTSLDVLDVDVIRNAYGRQVDSFITPALHWTIEGERLLSKLPDVNRSAFEGVFIRAPKISRVGNNVTVLATYKDEPVLVRHGNILAATFHPELSHGPSPVHDLLFSFIRSERF